MDAATKRELATAIRTTSSLRESSWDRASRRYEMTYIEAAQRATADPDIQVLIVALLMCGYSDFHAWADRILDQQDA